MTIHSPFASPFPQTPTPGGNSSSLHHRPPLTSIKPFSKPFGYPINRPTPQLPVARKPHPLAQVSIINSSIDSVSHRNSHELSMDSSEASLQQDLDNFQRQQQPHQAQAQAQTQARYASNIIDDNGTTEDDETEVDDLDNQSSEDSHSLRLGLSSLSPPGIGRLLPTHRLSSGPADLIEDEFEFSRDISPVSLSPVRRPPAPTPLRSTEHKNTDQDRPDDVSGQPTPPSGFEGMAHQLRRDFEQLTGLPAADPKHLTRDNSATLRGNIPPDGSGRAKRVFGAEMANQVKPRPLHVFTSTPPAGLQAKKAPSGPVFSFNPQRNLAQPAIRIVEPSLSATDQNKFMHDGSLTAPAKKVIGGGNSVRVPDVTGLTDALKSPEKAEYELASSKNQRLDHGQPDPTLNEALTLLRRRLTTLESDNAACQGRIQELQTQLTRERGNNAKQRPEDGPAPTSVERMVQKLKVYTRKLNGSIETHAQALDELNAFKNRNRHVREEVGAVRSDVGRWSDEVGELKRGLEGLAGEVREIRGMIEGVMEARSGAAVEKAPGMVRLGAPKTQTQAKRPAARPARSHSEQSLLNPDKRSGIEAWRSQASTPRSGRSFIGADEIERLKKDIAHEQSVRASQARPPNIQAQSRASAPVAPPPPLAQQRPTPVAGPSKPPPPAAPMARVSSFPTTKKPSAMKTPAAPTAATPTPNLPQQIAQEMSRAEAILKSVPARRHAHDNSNCSECRRRRQVSQQPVRVSSAPPATTINSSNNNNTGLPERGRDGGSGERGAGPGPQTVLVKVIHELEEDFEVHRKIFVELSDAYRGMEPAKEDLVKRKALASHLKESVDTLEKKAQQIHELYSLLEFKDLPLE